MSRRRRILVPALGKRRGLIGLKRLMNPGTLTLTGLTVTPTGGAPGDLITNLNTGILTLTGPPWKLAFTTRLQPATLTETGPQLTVVRQFLPPDLPNLARWYKADAITGLNDGDPITTWPDSSANADNLTQATAANKPTYKTAIQNGLPAVRFDGSNDRMSSGGVTGLNSDNPWTIYTVVKPNDTAGTTYIVEDTTGDSPRSMMLATEVHRIFAGANLDTTTSGIVTTSLFTDVLNGSSSTMRYNGSTERTGNSGTNTWDALVRVGSSSIPNQFFNGDMFELIIYNAAHTSTQWSQVESYLNTKWAIF